MIDIKALRQRASYKNATATHSPSLVIALCDEIERLKDCLNKANDQAEHFEREWYLRGDEVERLRTKLEVTDKTKFDGIDCRDETIRLQDDAIGQLQEQNRWLDTKLTEAVKDAARYQWLRDSGWNQSTHPEVWTQVTNEYGELDDAIDDAMEAK